MRKLLPLLVVIGLAPAGSARAVTPAEPVTPTEAVTTEAVTLAEPVTPAEAGMWTWPVVGPILRGFDPPDSPFGSGHRGIDIAAAPDTPVLAAAPGVVSFAGPVGGRLFVTLDHGGGLESTYSFLASLAVRRGAAVVAGQVLGTSGTGHVGTTVSHLHLGVRLDDAYVDPLAYLGPVEVWRFIRLAPLA